MYYFIGNRPPGPYSKELQAWLDQFIIGTPRSVTTGNFTMKQEWLLRDGYIGVYSEAPSADGHWIFTCEATDTDESLLPAEG